MCCGGMGATKGNGRLCRGCECVRWKFSWMGRRFGGMRLNEQVVACPAWRPRVGGQGFGRWGSVSISYGLLPRRHTCRFHRRIPWWGTLPRRLSGGISLCLILTLPALSTATVHSGAPPPPMGGSRSGLSKLACAGGYFSSWQCSLAREAP